MMIRALIFMGSLALTACAPIASDITGQPVDAGGGIGDGIARPMLQMMALDEANEALNSPSGCEFVAQQNDLPILRATGKDDLVTKGRAVVKLNDIIVQLDHEAFGIAAVERGGQFRSEALMVAIERPDSAPQLEADDSYYWPAKLNITQDEGGSNSYEGLYICTA